MTSISVRLGGLALVCLFGSAGLLAQAVPVAGPVGSVAGTITCGDTQRPARFAKVTLTPVKTDAPDMKGLSEKSVKDDPASAMKLMGALMGSVTMLQAQTGLDGTYSIAGVAPGDYYLVPTAPGYVSSAAAAQAAAPDGATAAQKMAGVPVVHVEANHAAAGNATMERGAAITGKVVYDDGSPAAGVVVRFENYEKGEKKAAKKTDDDAADMAEMSETMSLAMSGGFVVATTDDRGRFRLAGLATGDYMVEATVTVKGGFSMRAGVMDLNEMKGAAPLKFFAPGTLHQKDAEKITVKAGDERGDIEVKVDLANMRSVSGRVLSAVDHHGLNAGTVTMTDTTDAGVKRTGSVDATGGFTVGYVPVGTYLLEVSDGADQEPAKKKPGAPASIVRFQTMKTVKSYDDATQTVIVAASDVAGVNVELKESKTVKKDFDLNEMLGAAAGASKE